MLVDLLVVLGLLGLLGAALVALAFLGLTVPLVDWVNVVLRKLGLAGAYFESRSVGGRGVGVVDTAFAVPRSGGPAEGKLVARGELWNATCDPTLARELAPGDHVEFVYGKDLTVSVLRKTRA